MENFDMKILVDIASFIVPGYITLQISDAIKPKKQDEKTKEVHFLIYCVIYSFVNTYLYHLASNIEVIKNINSDLVMLLISILVGIIIGIANPIHIIYLLLGLMNVDVKDPVPTAWDYVLLNHANSFIIITLSDNSKLRGWWGENSYAADASHGGDIYIEKIYDENENGEWIENKNSKGIYLSKGMVKMIELKGEDK